MQKSYTERGSLYKYFFQDPNQGSKNEQKPLSQQQAGIPTYSVTLSSQPEMVNHSVAAGGPTESQFSATELTPVHTQGQTQGEPVTGDSMESLFNLVPVQSPAQTQKDPALGNPTESLFGATQNHTVAQTQGRLAFCFKCGLKQEGKQNFCIGCGTDLSKKQ